MDASMLDHAPTSLAIDGIAWTWRAVTPAGLEPLLPFVMAADPSGTEALYWKQEATAWLDVRGTPRGIVGVECLAGLTLALFFYALPASRGDGRLLAIERLRWLELARPHRSLDASLAIIGESARRLACDTLRILPHAATERHAKVALDERAETAGFGPDARGWIQRL